MEQDRADGIKTKEQDTNTDAVRSTRTGTLHGEHYLPQLGQRHPGDPETTGADPRHAARDTGRHSRASQASRDTWTDIHKVGIHFIRCGRGEGDSVTSLTRDQRMDSTVKRATTPCSQLRLDIRPTVNNLIT